MLKDQWEKAERNLLASLQANEALHDQLYACQSLLSLGHLYYLLRRFPKASEYLQRAYLLISENNYLRELAIFHEYQGSLELSQGKLDSAHHHFQEAVHIGEEIAPKGAIVSQAYRLLAEFQTERGDYQEALISCERSLLASRGIGEKLEEAITYRTLGRIHGQNGDSAKSKQNFDQAIQILEEVGAKFELAKTYAYMVKCKSYEFWEKMKFLGWAEELTSRLDTPYYQAKVYVDFAQLFLQIHKFEVAKDFIKKSRDLFEKLNEKAELESLSALEKTMGEDFIPGQPVSVSHSADSSSSEIITQNKTILEILENARQVMDLDITILLEGETGTGKDLLAKFIHYTSNRKNGEFVVVSCAAIPEGLFESELFGYKKGAFTGAVADKKGLVDEASGGTLYLDEIAEVPLSTQVKLLRAIEEKEIVRVGEVKPRKVDFRVIAATNKDMDDLVKDGKFRNDLFYRLNGMRFKLPPLRERKDDIPPLVEHFLKKCAVNGMKQNRICDTRRPPMVPSVDPRVLELLLNYDWPGNIRELENEVKKIFISSKGEPRITPSMCNGILEKLINEVNEEENTEKGNLLDQRAEYEKEKIEKALTKTNGNKTQAARLLGISEALLRFKMKRFNITLP
jgi:transcriptional regulator with PAS, ATPase and Fis domain